MGLASFFRDHIQDFSWISGHLTALTKKESTWKGGELPSDALEAFETLKIKLLSNPIISYARNDLPFKIYCDASAGTTEKNGNKILGGLGVVLAQEWEDGKDRVIGYASRKLHKHEENYGAFLLEMLAMTFATSHFHHYLFGQPQFKIYSDHKPLLKLNKVHQKTKHRLEEDLRPYHFKVVYLNGEEQEAADFLSRNAIDELKEEPEKDELPPTNLEEKNQQLIKDAQRRDPTCQLIRRLLNGEVMTETTSPLVKRLKRKRTNLNWMKTDFYGSEWTQGYY